MKKYLTLFTAGIILIISSCATNSDIDNLQSQIDELKSGQIASIANQINSINGSITSLQETDREIKGYITALQNTASELQKSINSADGKIDDLEKALAIVNTAIENLKAKDSALEQRISDLKDYVDTQLRSAKDWVSATFATLEQYNGIVSEIGGIKGSISSINTAMEQMESRLNGKITLMKGEIEEAYTKAIGSLESSLKNWVNEQLEGYWTIAETEGKLNALRGSLEKEDESIREDIGKLRSSLDSAKTELTEGYKAAIKSAIETNNGVLDGKLSEAVSSLNTRIDGEVSTINERIDEIEKRVASLEAQVTALVSRIQSLAYIPRYDDGASTMWRKYKSDGSIELRDTLDFRVSPADCADALIEVWESAVSAEAISVLTRGTQETKALPVLSVTGGKGMISVVLDGSSLSEEFYAGEQRMKVVVIISDGNNERTSEYVSMISKEDDSELYKELTGIALSKEEVYMWVGGEVTITAQPIPENVRVFQPEWKSSDNSIVVVNGGHIIAKNKGSATISAFVGEITTACNVYVIDETDCYIDEYGVNYGIGTYIKGVTWAPVNCGYSAEQYPYGKLYQWGRKDGQGYSLTVTMNDDEDYSKGGVSIDEAGRIVRIEQGPIDSAPRPDTYYFIDFFQSWRSWFQNVDATMWNIGTEEQPEKNIENDPCPNGWRVPTKSEALTLAGREVSSLQTGEHGATKEMVGLFLPKTEGEHIFLPCSGYRECNSGIPGKCGGRDREVAYHVSTYAPSAFQYGFTWSLTISTGARVNVNYGFYTNTVTANPVRCVKE